MRAVSRSGRVTPTSGSLESHIGVSGPVRERRPPRPLDKPKRHSEFPLPAPLSVDAAAARRGPGRRPGARRGSQPHARHAGRAIGDPLAAVRRRRLRLHDLCDRARRRGRCAHLLLDLGARHARCRCAESAETEARTRRSSSCSSSAWPPPSSRVPAASHLFNRSTDRKPGADRRADEHRRREAAQHRTCPQPPHFEWLPIIIASGAGFAILGFLGIRTLRRERARLARAAHPRAAVRVAPRRDARRPVREPGSARGDHRGLRPRWSSCSRPPACRVDPPEAPLEYLGRALGELRASGAALGRLTGLFQWAKFSSHEVDESMRTRRSKR